MMVDLSQQNRRGVEKLLRRNGFLSDASVTDDSRVLSVVSALVAAGGGVMPQEAVYEAMSDPSVVQAARAIIAKVGA